MYDEPKGLREIDTPTLPRHATMRERLERNRKVFTEQLGNVNRALELLDKNPVFEEVQEAITRAL